MKEHVAVYDRRILLSRDFATRSQTLIEEAVVRLWASHATAPIEIWIDSAGGYVNKAQMLGDLFGKVSAPIVGVVVGVAYSSAFYLLQLCDVRVAWPSSQLLFHSLEGATSSAQSSKVGKAELQALEDKMFGHIAKRSGQKHEDVVRWAKEERCWSADEALRHGFIDLIDTTRVEKDLSALLRGPS